MIKSYLENLGRGLVGGFFMLFVLPFISVVVGAALIGISIIGQNNEDIIKRNEEEK